MIFKRLSSLIILISIFGSIACHAREVYGDIFAVPAHPFKASQNDCDRLKEKGYEIETKENDIFIRIWATSKGYPDTLYPDLTKEQKEDTEGSCNWADHRHPHLSTFPHFLPLKLFMNENGELKKEGDTVVLYHTNEQTKEQIKIVLTLNQKDYRYASCGYELKPTDFASCVKKLQAAAAIFKTRNGIK